MHPLTILAPLEAIASVALVAILIYTLLVVMLRLSGKRTLAQFNAFDFIVTVAIGSMVANTVLDDATSLVEGAVGIAVLIVCQMAVSLAVTRWPRARRMVKSRPRLLYYRGDFLRKNLIVERVATEEVRQAVRDNGFAAMDQVLAVVLESDGQMSVVGSQEGGGPFDSLATVVTGEKAGVDTGQSLPPVASWDADASTHDDRDDADKPS